MTSPRSEQALRAILESGAVSAAPALLGCVLSRLVEGTLLSARIVETEAYTQDDPASHSFGRRTPRNEPMFGRAGTAYVYTSYGMHRCLNVVTGGEGIGEAVLVRGVEPIEGVDAMIAYRAWSGRPRRDLCNGPGKICQAMRIGLEWNLRDLLTGGELRLEPGSIRKGESILATPRIGITKAVDLPRRFVLSSDQRRARCDS